MPSEKLEQYLDKWTLSNPQPLAETATSQVYMVDYQGERVVLKMLTPIGIQDESGGAVALRCWDGQGAVTLLEQDEAAHLLEYIDGGDLVPMVAKGDDDAAAHIIGDVLNQIHSAYTRDEPAGLWGMERRFLSLFNRAKGDKAAGRDTIFVRGAAVARQLIDKPQHETVLHGDIHHWNIKHHATRGWLCYDPKGMYGEKTYDAANTLYNPGGPDGYNDITQSEDRILRISKILAEKMGLAQERVLAYAFAYGCLSASWSMEDGDSGEGAIIIAKIIEPHVAI